MRTASYRKAALWLVIPALLILAFIVSAVAAHDLPQPPSSKTQLVGQRQFSSWSYLATEQSGTIVVDVQLNRKDKVGLRHYIQENTTLAADLFTRQAVVEGQVVFTHPLRESQLPEVVEQGRDRVTAYDLRINGAKGEKFTIFGAPDADAFLPKEMIASFQHDVEHKTGSAELKGFTSLTMTMNATEYAALTRSPHVLFVDIIPTVAVEDAQQTFSAAMRAKPVVKQYAPTYWYHEESLNP